jgi:hypothetical protein
VDRDQEFRKWYDARMGTKSESFAYDVWCAAWDAARSHQKPCECINREWCDLHDTCYKSSPIADEEITIDHIMKLPKIIDL